MDTALCLCVVFLSLLSIANLLAETRAALVLVRLACLFVDHADKAFERDLLHQRVNVKHCSPSRRDDCPVL